MSQLIECGCGARLRAAESGALAVCPSCGTEHDVPPSGRTVWSEEYVKPERPIRSDPPRYVEAKADEVYTRVAGRRVPRPKKRWVARAFIVGVGSFILAAVLSWFDLDRPLLRMPSIALVLAGFVTLMKAVMGYTK
jgi:hypothetical protein